MRNRRQNEETHRDIFMQISLAMGGKRAETCVEQANEASYPIWPLSFYRPVMQAILKRHTAAPDLIFHTRHTLGFPPQHHRGSRERERERTRHQHSPARHSHTAVGRCLQCCEVSANGRSPFARGHEEFPLIIHHFVLCSYAVPSAMPPVFPFCCAAGRLRECQGLGRYLSEGQGRH